jgi:septum formation protein
MIFPINLKIILASQSPRRAQLLSESGFYQITIKPTDVDETVPKEIPVKAAAEYLARKKAKFAEQFITENEIVLAADTIVIRGKKMYNKPENYAAAAQMLRKLSGKVHEVITGVCLIGQGKEISFSEITQVTFAEMSDAEINFYVSNYKPFDKAGAYGVQEWIGHCKINKIIGSYSNVMGLPMHRVYTCLQENFG